jgi:type VI secretion system secreted protein Hcp
MKTSSFRALAALVLFSAGTLLPAMVSASTLYFVKFEGIDGESQVEGHRGAIDVLAFSFGASNSGSGKVNVQDLSFTKRVDSTSPLLFRACVTGTHYGSVKLTCARASGDGKPREYLTITLSDVLVSSVSGGGSAGDDGQSENISLNFEKLEMTVRRLNSDGSLGAPVTTSWSASKKKP